MTEKEHSIFIKHILEAIKESEKSLENLSSEFLKDIYKRAAAVRRIEIVGEAVKNLPADFKDKYTEIPWKNIVGTRDKLIHQYFGVDWDIIWEILKIGFPDLKKQLKTLLNKEKMLKCSYCGKEYDLHRGLTLVLNSGDVKHFCSAKCRKNFGMKRRKIRWVSKVKKNKAEKSEKK